MDASLSRHVLRDSNVLFAQSLLSKTKDQHDGNHEAEAAPP